MLVATSGVGVLAANSRQTSRMGLVAYNCAIRRKWLQQREPSLDLFEPLTFLKHCRELGAGGMQTSLGVLDAPGSERTRLRRATPTVHRRHRQSAEGRCGLVTFEAEIRTAAEVGVQGVRTVVMRGDATNSSSRWPKFARQRRER